MLDSMVPARRIGADAIRRPVLVALGILPDGRKGIIDFQLARAAKVPPNESACSPPSTGVTAASK